MTSNSSVETIRGFLRIHWGRLVRTAEHRAVVVGLFAWVTLVLLMFKGYRVVHRRPEESSLWTLDLFRSDILLMVGLAAFSLALLHRVESKRGRCIVVGLTQVTVGIVVIYELIASFFFATTQSTFDLHLLLYSVGQPSETLSVITAVVPINYWLFLVGMLAIIAVLPWFVRSQFQPDDILPESKETSSTRWRNLAIAATIAVAVACLPTMAEPDVPLGRASILEVPFSLVDIAQGIDVRDDRPPLDDLELVTAGKEEVQKRNVVFIILESVRARSTTVHRPELKTTPFLAQLAEESLVAERAYAPVPHTSKALVAIHCGVEPRLRMAITESWPGGLPGRCLPELLGDYGYDSIFFQSATEKFENRPGLVENMGFDDFIGLEEMDGEGYERANYFGKEDAVMLDPSDHWLENHDKSPFVASYLTVTPHHDYQAPGRYGHRMFVDDDDVLNRYKNSIYYVDHFVDELIDQYREHGYYDDTVFVIVGDHGEGFGEHGRIQHDNVIWEEGLHIPLMIYDPRNPAPKRIENPVSQIDLLPTLAHWLGFELDGGPPPGYRLQDIPDDRRVQSYCWYEDRCIANIGKRWKYIYHFDRRPPEVYDLVEDPMETENQYEEKSQLADQWKEELYDWRAKVNGFYVRK